MIAAAGLTAACENTAGSMQNQSSFGASTSNNNLVQSAYLNSEARVVLMNDRFRAAATDTVNFDFDKSVLDGEARSILAGQAAWLKSQPTVRMRVFGHTDKVGSDGYNDRLGLRRARAVVRELVRLGVKRNRLDAVISRGEKEPVVDTEDRERRNRRTVTQVAGFTTGFVGDGMDGKRAALVYGRYVSDKAEAASAEGTN
jgi:outer membrane protein OmpA-like peptidoglycan-associated protein